MSIARRIALPIAGALLLLAALWWVVGVDQTAPKPGPVAAGQATLVARIEPRPPPAPATPAATPSPTPSPEEPAPVALPSAGELRKISGALDPAASPSVSPSPSPVKESAPNPGQPRSDTPRPRDPPPPRDMRPLPSPKDAALTGALEAVRRCGTMQLCVEAAGQALALFGGTEPLPQPGTAHGKDFDEARATYRRAQAQVLKMAKDLSQRPGGESRTEWLRGIFEAMPSFQSWEMDDAEIGPIRRAAEKAMAKWMKDRKVSPGTTFALSITVLTAGGPNHPLTTDFSYPRENAPPGVGELVAYLRAELAAVPKVAESVRQRRAVLKILVSPGGSFAVD